MRCGCSSSLFSEPLSHTAFSCTLLSSAITHAWRPIRVEARRTLLIVTRTGARSVHAARKPRLTRRRKTSRRPWWREWHIWWEAARRWERHTVGHVRGRLPIRKRRREGWHAFTPWWHHRTIRPWTLHAKWGRGHSCARVNGNLKSSNGTHLGSPEVVVGNLDLPAATSGLPVPPRRMMRLWNR